MTRAHAILIIDSVASGEESKIAKILDFFGVSWRTLRVAEFLTGGAAERASFVNSRVLCSADTFCGLVERLQYNPASRQLWEAFVHSAFVYAGDDSETVQRLARNLTGDSNAALHTLDQRSDDLVVSENLENFCGVFTGVRVPVDLTDCERALASNGSESKIISLGHSSTFVKLHHCQVPVFFSTSGGIIDIDTPLAAQNFDIKPHFMSTVPLLLYVRWAFEEACWAAPEAMACLIIDDPVLKPTYGFINFQDLLNLMTRCEFTTNVAFIPWNWRRSDPAVARLFKENPEKYSISIHGCDHTAAEFGTGNIESLIWKAKRATERMLRHETQTGIRHDRIMVFPQGVFSEAAMGVLKHTNFMAAMNTEVVSAAPRATAIKISDVWDVAVMRYSCFPLFTRRYPSQGIENFAFDILLGKPCVVVIHHDFCRDRSTHLIEFIGRLNALKCRLSWCGLGEVVKRSCRQRELSPGTLEVEMYGSELRLENRSDQRKRFIIRRREADPSAIKEIRAGSGQIPWNPSHGYIDFETELSPGESRIIAIRFQGLSGNGQSSDNVWYRIMTMLRRYLCEVRDNYVRTN